ncbi:MAG: MATE family efflux transporter [Kiloniellales bacterium]|nr:MATE family efflux transporter [Kiloniellales bacterium]
MSHRQRETAPHGRARTAVAGPTARSPDGVDGVDGADGADGAGPPRDLPGDLPRDLRRDLRAETRSLLAIAAPLAAAYLAEIAMMITDMVIVGRLGSVPLAAVGLASNLVIEILVFSMAIVSIVAVLVAQAVGGGEAGSGTHHVRQGLWVASALSVPGMALGWNLPALLALTGQEPPVLAYAERYLQAVVWCIAPSLWFVVLRGFVAALSRAQSVMVITVAAVGLNAALSYGLVFGVAGLPALGVAGAGWATTIVCWVMFAALAWHVGLGPRFRGYRLFAGLGRLDQAACRQILRLGLPLGGLALMEGGLFAVTAILMGVIGAAALAANQVVITVVATTFVVAMALGEAAAIRVAHGVGAGEPARAQRAGLLGIALGVVFMASAAVVLLAAPEALTGLFLDPEDPANRAAVELTATLFVIAALFQVSDGVQAIASRALRGLRDTFAPMWIAGLGYWGLGIPGGYLLGFVAGYGAAGLWWGLALGLSATAAMLTWRFLRLSWRLRRAAEAPAAASGAPTLRGL